MTYTVILVPMPPSSNHIWRMGKGRAGQGRMYRSATYLDWLTEAGYALKQQEPAHIEGHYTLKLTFGPRRSNSDLDNRCKAVSDLLVKHQIVDDDNLADKITLEWGNVHGCQVEVETV